MTYALLDPALVQVEYEAQCGSAPATFDALAALNEFFALCRRHILRPARFLPSSFLNSFRPDPRRRGVSGQFVRWCRLLMRDDEPDAIPDGCSLPGAPRSELDAGWYCALDETTRPESDEQWRDPMIFVPHAHKSMWPAGPEVEVMVRGRRCQRVLVTIEEASLHPHALPDLDPWLLGSIGNPDDPLPPPEQRGSRRRLPRPRCLAELPMDEWRGVLDGLSDWTCNLPTHRFYLPESRWDPVVIPKDVWRRNAAFPNGTKAIRGGRKNGPVDREGRVWAYDPLENHWDVQDADEKKLTSYDVVSHDGRYIRRGGG